MNAIEPLVLPAFVVEVERAHPAVVAARHLAGAAARRVAPAGSWEDPFLALGPDGISAGGGGPGVVRYQVSQSIPVSGRPAARAEAEMERARAAAADAATIERAVRVAAIQTFYRALHNQRAMELNEELRVLVGEAVDSGTARYRTGAANHHEWLLAKAELGVLETEGVRLESERRVLRVALNELRDRPPDAPIGRLLEPPRLAETRQRTEVSRSDSPELESARAMVRSAEARRRVARLDGIPDLLVQAMVEDPRRGMEEPMWGVLFGVSLPVFWFRKQGELLAAAARERDAAAAARRGVENRLRAEDAEARSELEAARATLRLYEESVVPLTELALESARSGYTVGSVSLPELVTAARARAAQQLERLAARIDVEIARVRLAELLSTPPVLRLAPATPTLFGGGMGARMPANMGMTGPSAIRLGRGVGLGAARGSGGEPESATGGEMPGMGGM